MVLFFFSVPTPYRKLDGVDVNGIIVIIIYVRLPIFPRIPAKGFLSSGIGTILLSGAAS